MKKIIFSSLALIWSFLSVSQATFYSGKLSNRHYQILHKPTKLSAIPGNPDLYLLELNKAWRFFDELTDNDTMTIGNNGFIVTSGQNFSMAFDPFLAELGVKSNVQSGIYVELDTLSRPKRISVEWRDMELEGNPAGDVANFRVNLYSNQVVEFHYGNCVGTDTTAFRGQNGPQVVNTLLSPDFFTVYEFHVVHGDPAQPTFSPFPINSNLNSVPASGTLFRFEPFNLSSEELQTEGQVAVYPNPAQDEIRIPGIESGTVKVLDSSGRQMLKLPIEGGRVSLTDLEKGLYFLQIESSEGRQPATATFVKQ